MMIEPTLDNPRSEIIELLINTLDVDPERVMDLACRLTSPVTRAKKAAATALLAPTPTVVPTPVPSSAAAAARVRKGAGTKAKQATQAAKPTRSAKRA